MALSKRPLTKDSEMQKPEDQEIKRKKRSTRSDNDENVTNKQLTTAMDQEKLSTPLPQKKRSLPPMMVNGKTAKHGSDEQADDETLIRETQAALKSLSGSWSDTRSSLYRLNDQDENPQFQNLFEEQKHQKYDNRSLLSLKRESDSFMYFPRQKENDQDRVNSQNDFDNGDKKRIPFSQASAFKPPIDVKRSTPNGVLPMPYTYSYSGDSSAFISYPPSAATNSMMQSDKHEKCLKDNHNEEENLKTLDTPDTKQYTTLQPAGVGSRAASVLQDMHRSEGVFAAVTPSTGQQQQHSSSSPSGMVSSTTTNDKMNMNPAFEHTIQPPTFSPGSLSRGEFLFTMFVFWLGFT